MESSEGLERPSQPEPFVLRIVSLDYYLGPPLRGLDVCYSHFAGEAVEQVPVVRIFGSTPAGQKACLHLRKAFPYFYIPYDEDLPNSPPDVSHFLRRLAQGLDRALDMAGGGAGPLRQHVFGMLLVRGTPFYGYHAHERVWVKILMYDPRDIGRAAMVLQSGGVLGRKFQPHESHIPYLLQVKVDFNLFGMGFIRLSKVLFRHPLPESHSRHRLGWAPQHTQQHVERGGISETAGSQSTREWTASNTPAAMQWGSADTGPAPPRQSTCQLECDACVEHILNRGELLRIPLDSPFPEVRLVESLAPMWEEERQRCGGSLPNAPPDPLRTPQLLSHAVTAVRQQFQLIANQQAATMGLPSPAHAAPSPATAPSPPPATPCPGLTPIGPPPSPLLGLTQAANRIRFPTHATPFTADRHVGAAAPAAAFDHQQQQQAGHPPGGQLSRGLQQQAFGAAGAAEQTPAPTRRGVGAPGWGEGTLVDEHIIMTQFTKKKAQEAPEGALEGDLEAELQRWVADQAEREGGLLAGESDEEMEEGSEGGGEREEEGVEEGEGEDLLMAMAEAADDMVTPGSQWRGTQQHLQGSQLRGTQRAGLPRSAIKDPYQRALASFEHFLAASQRECDAILGCTRPQEPVPTAGERFEGGEWAPEGPPGEEPQAGGGQAQQERYEQPREQYPGQYHEGTAEPGWQRGSIHWEQPEEEEQWQQPVAHLAELAADMRLQLVGGEHACSATTPTSPLHQGALSPCSSPLAHHRVTPQEGQGQQQHQLPQGPPLFLSAWEAGPQPAASPSAYHHSHPGPPPPFHAANSSQVMLPHQQPGPERPQQQQQTRPADLEGGMFDIEDMGGSQDDDDIYLEALHQFESAQAAAAAGHESAHRGQHAGQLLLGPPPHRVPQPPLQLQQPQQPQPQQGGSQRAPAKLARLAGEADLSQVKGPTPQSPKLPQPGTMQAGPGPSHDQQPLAAQSSEEQQQLQQQSGQGLRAPSIPQADGCWDTDSCGSQHAPAGQKAGEKESTAAAMCGRVPSAGLGGCSYAYLEPLAADQHCTGLVDNELTIPQTDGGHDSPPHPLHSKHSQGRTASQSQPQSQRYGHLSFVSTSPRNATSTGRSPAGGPSAAAAAGPPAGRAGRGSQHPQEQRPAAQVQPPGRRHRGRPGTPRVLGAAQAQPGGVGPPRQPSPAVSNPAQSVASGGSVGSAGRPGTARQGSVGPAPRQQQQQQQRQQQQRQMLQPRVAGLRRPSSATTPSIGTAGARPAATSAPAKGAAGGHSKQQLQPQPSRRVALPLSPTHPSTAAAVSPAAAAASSSRAHPGAEQQPPGPVAGAATGGEGRGVGRVVPGLMRSVALHKRRHGGSKLVFSEAPKNSSSNAGKASGAAERSSQGGGAVAGSRLQPLPSAGSHPSSPARGSIGAAPGGSPPAGGSVAVQQVQLGHGALPAGAPAQQQLQLPEARPALASIQQEQQEEEEEPISCADALGAHEDSHQDGTVEASLLQPPQQQPSRAEPALGAAAQVAPAEATPLAYLGREEVRLGSQLVAAARAVLLHDSSDEFDGPARSQSPLPVSPPAAAVAAAAAAPRVEQGQVGSPVSSPPLYLSREQVRISSQLVRAAREALQSPSSSPSPSSKPSSASPPSFPQPALPHSPMGQAPQQAAGLETAPAIPPASASPQCTAGGGRAAAASPPADRSRPEGEHGEQGLLVIPDSQPTPPLGQAGSAPEADGSPAAGVGPMEWEPEVVPDSQPTPSPPAPAGPSFPGEPLHAAAGQTGSPAAVAAALGVGQGPEGEAGEGGSGGQLLRPLAPAAAAGPGQAVKQGALFRLFAEGDGSSREEEDENEGCSGQRSGDTELAEEAGAEFEVVLSGFATPARPGAFDSTAEHPGQLGGEHSFAAAPAQLMAALVRGDIAGHASQPQEQQQQQLWQQEGQAGGPAAAVSQLEPTGEEGREEWVLESSEGGPSHSRPSRLQAGGLLAASEGGMQLDGGGGGSGGVAGPCWAAAVEGGEGEGEEASREDRGSDSGGPAGSKGEEGEWWREASQVDFEGLDDEDCPMFDLESDWVEGYEDHQTLPSEEEAGGGPAAASQGAVLRDAEAMVEGQGRSGEEQGMGSGELCAFRPRRLPPTQAELEATMWERGLEPVVHQTAFYGNPEDVPERPPVFAGQQFRVPSSSVQDLPPFGPGGHRDREASVAWQQLRMRAWALASAQRTSRPRLFAFVPARPPPSREGTEAWLAARRARRKRQRGRSAAAERSGGFRMDGNTGKLLPSAGGAGGEDDGGSGGSQGPLACDDADLLGTPLLCTLGSGRGTPSQEDRSEGEEGGGAGSTLPGPHGQAAEEEVRVASPKYDPRNLSFSTLAASSLPPSRQQARGRAGAQLALPPRTTTQAMPFPCADVAGAAAEADGAQGNASSGLLGHSPGDVGGEGRALTPLPPALPPLRTVLHPATVSSAAAVGRQATSSRLSTPQGPSGAASEPAAAEVKPGAGGTGDLLAAALVGHAVQQQGLGSSQPSQGEQPQLPATQQEEEAEAVAAGAGDAEASPQETPAASHPRPPSALLRSVLKSSLKGGGASRVAQAGGEGVDSLGTGRSGGGSAGAEGSVMRRPSQPSQGNGSSKKVSFLGVPEPEPTQVPPTLVPPTQPPSQEQQEQQQEPQPPAQLIGAAAPGSATRQQPTPRPSATPAATTATATGNATTTRGRPSGRWVSQITPPSPLNSKGTPLSQAGFKHTVAGKGQQLTLLSVEVHADSRGSLLPDPRYDAVRAIFLSVMDDDEEVPDGKYTTRILMCDQPTSAGLVPAEAGQPLPPDAAAAGAAPATAVEPPPLTSCQVPSAFFSPRRPPRTPAHDTPAQSAGVAGQGGGGLCGPVEPAARPLPIASTASQFAARPTHSPAPSKQGQQQPPGHLQTGQELQGQRGLQGSEGDAESTPAEARGAVRSPAAVDALGDVQVDIYPTEVDLLAAFVDAVRTQDPDLVVGYEVQHASLGYLTERSAALGMSLLRAAGRLPEVGSIKEESVDEYGWMTSSGVHMPGRIVLNVWRLMRQDLKLNIYSLENCAAAVLQLRVPHVPQRQLSAWFTAGPSGGRWRCLSYYVQRARLNLQLLDQLDLVGRTGEMARTFGLDFQSVLFRGSQIRVESMMLRLAHTQNYIVLSASKEQVARQPAMEIIPLVMEPQSRLYTDPVVVLDFQSLYPSMIIAYNLCYSTCLGRPLHAQHMQCGGSDSGELPKLGCIHFGLPLGTLQGGLSPDDLNIAPNGVAYAPPSVRPGVLPRLLREILETRIMVKGAMKRAPASARVLQRCLNARQFSLKLVANVTYGYTAAGFSGRMPMAELADSVVQSGRETLENAIRMVNSHPDWRARVVYGDTDSMFVLLPGRTREEAFKIGGEIAKAVTAVNPSPVMLKMEKVYDACVLLSKKRYVGYSYESANQALPVFDAKGIETVRRDTVPAVAKVMQRSLEMLFTTKDLSQVKAYLQRQWAKILEGRVSVQDFIFAKEVRLGTYSARAATLPPQALIATRAMQADPRAEPRFGERVRYVVVYEPGVYSRDARLIDMVVPPHALSESGGRLRLHGGYYIEKQIIPALGRALSLVGADLRAWFAEVPRHHRTQPQKRPTAALPLLEGGAGGGLAGSKAAPHKGLLGLVQRTTATTIDSYYLSRHCAVCDALTHVRKPLCNRCLEEPQLAAAVLASRWNRLERQHAQLARLCLHCGGSGGRNAAEGGVVCDSLDCGVYFERRKAWFELRTMEALAQAGVAALGRRQEQ